MSRRKDNPDRMTLTVPEAAKKLGIGRNQAYLAARAGDIPCVSIGDRILVLKAAFEKMLGPPNLPSNGRRRIGNGRRQSPPVRQAAAARISRGNQIDKALGSGRHTSPNLVQAQGSRVGTGCVRDNSTYRNGHT